MQLLGLILILVVIILYLAWLRYTRNQTGVRAVQKDGYSGAAGDSGAQEFDIQVKGVYSPSVIRAVAGKPVKINFIRKEDTECSRYVIFSDFKIRKELPQGEVVPVEFTPQQKGEFLFTCDMGMYQGRLIVE